MKRIFVVVLLASCLAIPAQETRREVTHATGNPAVDSKPNSPDVPDVFAVSGHLEPETTVFTFAVITLGVLDDSIEMSRFDDSSFR
jgi:hypothetical protein